MPFEPIKPDLRASDADREAAASRLRDAALEGRLDHEELEDRLERVYAARWDRELESLTADVTPPVFWKPESPSRSVNAYAVASLIAALGWFGWFGSLTAVILGHTALVQIRRSAGAQYGRTAALAGTALGYIGLCGLLMLVLLKFAI